MSDNYSQELVDHAKQSVTDALKTTSKSVIKKKSRSNWWFDFNKLTERITKVSKSLPQINSETITNEYDK